MSCVRDSSHVYSFTALSLGPFSIHYSQVAGNDFYFHFKEERKGMAVTNTEGTEVMTSVLFTS